jgi:hypothetical protein
MTRIKRMRGFQEKGMNAQHIFQGKDTEAGIEKLFGANTYA